MDDKPRDEIEITDEMVRAAAEVLRRDPFAGIGPTDAEIMTREMLALALSVRREKSDAGGRAGV